MPAVFDIYGGGVNNEQESDSVEKNCKNEVI